jgi:hypothetical protein
MQTKPGDRPAEEQEAIKRAEALKKAGFGSEDPIDINKEIVEQAEALKIEPNTAIEQAEADAQQADVPPQEMPRQPMGIERLIIEEDTGKKLEALQQMLSEISDNPPSMQDLAMWKNVHGDLFVLQLDVDQMYIYRYIKHQEWKQLLAEGNKNNINSLTEQQVEERLFDMCVLWPKVDHLSIAGVPAGLIRTVVEQVKIRSCFLDPAQVVQFTTKI